MQVVKNRKLQKGKKHATSVLESRQKRIPCSAQHADFGLRFCLCHAQLQVRLANTSSTITYGEEHFKAMAAHALIKPSLQTGDAEAAPARAEQAVGRVRSVCLAAGFLLRYGNVPGHIQVQSSSDRTFFKTGLMASSFLTITGIHSRYSPSASLLLYCTYFGSLHRLGRYLPSVRKSRMNTEFCTTDSFR